MAQKFKLLFFLSLVVACLVIPGNPVAAEAPPGTTDPPATNPSVSTQPSVTSDPIVSTKPSVTSDPIVSTQPSVTSDPIVSTQPAVTADPSVSTQPSVTADPSVSTKPSVTADPSVSTKPSVTADPSVSTKPSVTADPSVSATTTGSEVTDAETSTPSLTTPERDSCNPNPCGPGSTCEARVYPDYVCSCQTGQFYNNDSNSCQAAKVFPGDLLLSKMTYIPDMNNTESIVFLETAEKITNELDSIFSKNKDYSGSTVLKLEPSTGARVWSRVVESSVKATVEISFSAIASVTTEGVLKEIESHVKDCTSDCVLHEAKFTNVDLCNEKPCDEETTTCSSKDGSFKCSCGNSYISTDFSDKMCIACPSGKKADGNKCIECSFGRSGFNCSESWQLTLVIVASVLGGLLLITLIILPIVALKPSKKKSPKKNKNADVREPYVSPIPAKAPLANDSFANSQAPSANRSDNAFANAGVPRIPRATTTSSWDRGNLEMTPSNSRQNLVPGGRNTRVYEDDDDMAPYSQSRPQSSLYAQSRPQSSLYAQARPQGNPYAQNQSQVNPYASNQGHANPYYMQDDGRRFN